MIRRYLRTVVAAICLTAAPCVVLAQPVFVEATSDPAFEQLPILFHHGFNDDGRLWAVGSDGNGTGSPAEYWDRLEIRSPQGTLLQRGVPNYVVQYWARSNEPGFRDGDENATADEGWAALKSPEEIRTPGQNYNSPDPIGFFLDNADQLFNIIPECSVTPTSVSCTFPQAEFLVALRDRMVTSNYNRNGLVVHHSQDLADLFSTVFTTDARFAGLRQVNIITHSAGGLDTRATLHRLNESNDPVLQEAVANVIYTAPPFGGSTAAIFATRLYADLVTPTVFQDPWIRNGAGDMTLNELLIAVARSFGGPDAEGVMEIVLDFVPKPFGLDPTSVTVDQLANNLTLATAAVGFIHAARDLVTGLIGFPGEPKVSQDLTPWSAIDNLNRWQPNFHTKQFVTWGEGGGRINLTPSLAEAQAAYDPNGNCCEEFLDPTSLQRLPDDWALSNVSARILATPEGGMSELASYASLWHGNINTEMPVVGMDWARTLITPVTRLELNGPVPTVDAERRYYRVGPTATLRFAPESRTVRDRFGSEANVVASQIEYRLVTFGLDQARTHFPWVTVAPNTTVTFEELASGEADLSGERPFLVEWRSVSGLGAKEAIRSAVFSIDSTPPSIVLVDVFTPGVEDSPEVFGKGGSFPGMMFRRSDFVLNRGGLPNLPKLLDRHEMDWIIKNPATKILRIDFDEPGAIVRYQWDEFFTDPVTETLPNVTLAFALADLEPGPHTLYFEVSDQAGNESNAVQALHVLVDDQAPVVGLNYEGTGGLGFVVGPETPLEFVAEDVETGRVTGTLTVPGLDPVPVNSSFRLGQTSIADAAEGTEVLGLIVTMQAEATDAVGNTARESFDVYYDFSPPRIDLQYVGNSVLTSNGTYRTTDATVRVEVRVSDNAGYELPTWTATQPGTDVLRSGAPLVPEARDGRPFANGGSITLLDGTNVIVITVRDLVGNTSSLELIVEKAQTLIEDETNRPIELLSIHVDGAQTGGTGPANVSTSDDGSVFVFDSSRRDHVPDDSNNERDVFVWHNGTLIRANTTATGDEAIGGESRNPTVSGNGRYVYFASEATNLVSEATTGLNLYVKDLTTGRIALISRNQSGDPINLNSAFGRLSFLRLSATYSGRYVFFDDRFNGYVDGDDNGNLDVFVADLDPDVNGNFFDTPPVIHRVSVAADGSGGTGGALTGGSRYPSASRDGLFVAFQTDHTNLFPGDDNDTRDVVLARFAGVDGQGTIDFSSIEIVPLAVDAQGSVSEWGSEHPTIDRTGRSIVFTTAANLLQQDVNNEGVDNDVYRSTGFLENWKNRVLELVSVDGGGGVVSGRITANHAPSISDYTAADDPRIAYLADKASLVSGDLNGTVDLFVHSDDVEAINWLSADVPTTHTVLEGGVTPNGEYAWWVTIEEYSTVVGAGTGRDLYRRRMDPGAETEAPQIVTPPADISALRGEDVAFSVAASGRPSPSYQWLRDGQVIPGATNAVLFIDDVDFDDQGSYSVEVFNDAGSVTTASARLSVTSLQPVMLAEPISVEVREGETAFFTASVVGLSPMTFQWSRNGIPLVDDGRILGSTTDSLSIADTRPDDAGTYVLTATNPGGEVQSVPVTLTVQQVTATDEMQAVPTSFALDQNYPNPFNPSTSIRYALPQQERVRLEVYNLLGQRVRVLVDAVQPAGYHTMTMDGSDLASGAYFYVITAGSYTHARSFHLLK